jgi:hypothetical protein
MLVPPPLTNSSGLNVTLTEAQHKAAIQSPFQSDREARNFEDWLEARPQSFSMMGTNIDVYNTVMWVTSKFSGPLNIWWLYRKTHGFLQDTFNNLVTKIRKTFLPPNIRDDALNYLIGLPQGSISYAEYTQHFNEFFRRSRQPIRMI